MKIYLESRTSSQKIDRFSIKNLSNVILRNILYSYNWAMVWLLSLDYLIVGDERADIQADIETRTRRASARLPFSRIPLAILRWRSGT